MSLMRRLERGQPEDPQKPGRPEPEKKEGTGDLAGGSRLANLRPRKFGKQEPNVRSPYGDLKIRVQNRLLAEIDSTLDVSKLDEVRQTIQELFEQILIEENIVLTRPERQRLLDSITNEILGFGPLQTLLSDPTVTEIMVNGYENVYVERAGKLFKAPVKFDSDEHVMRIIDRIVSPLGRRVDEASPFVDARLPDGSRVNAVIPPISLVGPVLTIRMFSKDPISVDELVGYGSISQEAILFLKACVEANLNIVISGGTGSGKTTLLNVLSLFIPGDQRIVTIENAAELQLRQEHVVTLETRPPNIEAKGEISAQQLVVNALRMRPDRIIVGEIRSGEALDMLQAMNTGHEGSMTTAHANSPRDVISRIETMTLMAGYDLPLRAIREQIASAIDLIVHIDRMRDGTRKVTNIAEVVGMEGEIVTLTDLFFYEQTGFEENKVVGMLRSTGLRPTFIERMEAAGVHVPPTTFGVGQRQRF
ncbi:MAG: CpaF family protein [Anaerolineales bacterium]